MARLTRRRLLHGRRRARPPARCRVRRSPRSATPARAAMAGAATGLPRRPARGRARARGRSPSETRERLNWHYVPRGREGVPFKAMPAPARAAAHELMKASLSAVGYGKAVERDPARGACCASSRRSAALARSRELRVHGLRRPGRRRALGLARRGPSSLAQLHARAGQAGRGHAGLLRREPRRGAVGPEEGPARPRAPSRTWAARSPRA